MKVKEGGVKGEREGGEMNWRDKERTLKMKVEREKREKNGRGRRKGRKN